jgi:hypothetical protein
MKNGHNDILEPIGAIPFVFSTRSFLANGFSTLRFHLRNGVDDRGLKGQINKVRAVVEEVSTNALRNVALVPARVRGGIAEVVGQMDVR